MSTAYARPGAPSFGDMQMQAGDPAFGQAFDTMSQRGVERLEWTYWSREAVATGATLTRFFGLPATAFVGNMPLATQMEQDTRFEG